MAQSNTVTSTFIDLATYDEMEKYMYGGPDATAYFVRETRKSTWFSQVPVVLSRASGTPDFGQTWSVTISRAGDYLLNTWLRLTLPAVIGAAATSIAWTPNLMHALISECVISFNDLTAARMDNYHLDFWSAFTVPSSHVAGYNNMIGNTSDLTSPVTAGAGLPSKILNLPIPMFYTRDSGVALPTASLPYNDMRIQFTFRGWNELLAVISQAGAGLPIDNVTTGASTTDLNPTTAPALTAVQVWGTYAVVSNDERKRMAAAPRDILIEQVQTANVQAYAPATDPSKSYDLRFSHAIKSLFWAVRNTSHIALHSNYTHALPTWSGTSGDALVYTGGYDPVTTTTLTYENTQRLSQMGSDYFSLVCPFYTAPSIPDAHGASPTGLHMYNYTLDLTSLDPLGSTNHGKLTNVSILPAASTAGVNGANDADADLNFSAGQTYTLVVTAVNHNVVRVSGGALGFPIL